MTHKPTFSFPMRSPSSDSGFFRKQPARSVAESWDNMQDDDDDAQSGFDDSRALTYRREDSLPLSPSDETLDQYRPEVTAFALHLDTSHLLQSSPGTIHTALNGYDLIDSFIEYSAGQVDTLKEYIQALEEAPLDVQAAESHERRFNETITSLHYWELEHQTWELFGLLTAHRLDASVLDPTPRELSLNHYSSDLHVKQHLIDSEPAYKELTLVRQWLYKYAPNPAEKVLEAAGEYRGDRGWMYTKERIKSEKRQRALGKQLVAFSGGAFSSGFGGAAKGRNIVTELDPDAPTRQKKHLEEEDEKWDALLMKLLWAFIRKGDISGARELCEDAGQWWRAAVLIGGEEAWDPAVEGKRAEEISCRSVPDKLRGNKRRELWRRMCFAVARQKGGEDYEKAVYGVLCGDVDSVTPVCTSWEDHLFVHVNSLVEGYYAAYLAQLSRVPPAVSAFPTFDTTAYHSLSGGTIKDDPRIMPRIIDSLQAAPHLKPESRWPLRIIQGAFISQRFAELVKVLDRQLQNLKLDPDYEPIVDDETLGLDVCDCRMLRIVVHAILVLQALDAGFAPDTQYHEAAENVIAGYFDVLGSMGSYELVPLYASKLSSEKAVEVIGKLLIQVEGEDKRKELLKLMHLHEVDVFGCLRHTMALSLEMSVDCYQVTSTHERGILAKGFRGPLAEEDRQLISSLEWLVLGGDELRVDVITKGMEVYRRFLLTGRLLAAKTLYEKIPSKNIIPPEDDVNAYLSNDADITDADGYGVNAMFNSPETRLAATAFLEFESLIESIIALEEWHDVIKHRPQHADRSFKKTLTVAFERVQTNAFETAKNFLEYERFAALSSISTIRNIYVPELVIALHRIYIEAGHFINPSLLSNTLQLAMIVADPDRNVLRPFEETGRLKEYVDELAGASRGILGVAQEGRASDALKIWSVVEK